MKSKKLFQWMMAATLTVALPMCLFSCTDNVDNPASSELVDEDGDSIYVAPKKPLVPVTLPAYVSQMSETNYSRAVNALFPNRASLDDAMVAFVTPAEVGSYGGKLIDLYKRGGLIIIARPDGTNYKAFVEHYGLEDKLPAEQDLLSILTFAFNNKHRFYTVYDAKEEQKADREIDEQFYIDRFNFFTKWVSEQYEEQNARTRSGDGYNSGLDNVNPNSPDQQFNIDFPVHLYHQVTDYHSKWHVARGNSKNDNKDVGKDGNIHLCTNVWYYYVNESDANNKGDYYLVESTVTAENGNTWQPKTYKHIAEKVYVVGYFMTELHTKFTLTDGSKNIEPTFYGGPNPSTTQGSGTSSTGFSWGLNGGISAGLEGGMENGNAVVKGTLGIDFGFNVGWSNEQSYTIGDLSAGNVSENKYGIVAYNYTVNNFMPKADWDKSCKGVGYPEICRTNLTTSSSWIWKVPAGTNGVKDKKSTTFKIKADITPLYGCIHWWRGQAGVLHKSMEYANNNGKTSSTTLSLSSPLRTPFGVLALKNGATGNQSNNEMIRNIKIYKDGDEKNVYATIPNTYGPDETARIKLPVGKYVVKFEVINSETMATLGNYKYKDVVINSGKREDLASTRISTKDTNVIKE